VSNGVINLARVFEVGFDLFIFRKILLSLVLFSLSILHFLSELFLTVRPNLVSIDPCCLLAKHLLFPVLMFKFLETDLGTELFQVLMSLLEDLKEPWILLSVNHVDVGIEVIVLESLDTVSFLLVLCHLFLFLLWLKGCLDELGLFADVVDLLFVELCELFGMEEDLVEEFLMTSFLAEFLAWAHLLLESIKGSSLLFAAWVNFGALVELSINELSLIEQVTLSLLTVSHKSDLVLGVSVENLIPHLLLKRPEFKHL